MCEGRLKVLFLSDKARGLWSCELNEEILCVNVVNSKKSLLSDKARGCAALAELDHRHLPVAWGLFQIDFLPQSF